MRRTRGTTDAEVLAPGGHVFTPQQLSDPKQEPDWPRGDYSSPEYKAAAERHTAYQTQKERLAEEVAIARLLARRRLPLGSVVGPIEAPEGKLGKVPVFGGPMAPDDPRVVAWRGVLEGALEAESLRVYRAPETEGAEPQLDYDATVGRAEDALACLRLLKAASGD